MPLVAGVLLCWGLWQIPGIRTAAVRGGVRLFGRASVPWLVGALDDTHATVRRAAAEALGRISEAAEPAVPAVIHQLGDEDPGCRTEAARTLGRIGSPALEPLLEAVTDERPTVRQAAVEALGQIPQESPRVIPALIRQLTDEDANCRNETALALGRIGAPAVERLQEAVVSPNPHARASAALALGLAGSVADGAGRKSVQLLAAAITDHDAKVRREASGALCRLSPACKEAVGVLSKSLADADHEVRRWAAEALFKMDRDAAPAFENLLRALGNDDPKVRWWAARAVGNLFAASRPTAADGLWFDEKHAWFRHTTRVAAALESLVRADNHQDVRDAALEALYHVDSSRAALLGVQSGNGQYRYEFK